MNIERWLILAVLFGFIGHEVLLGIWHKNREAIKANTRASWSIVAAAIIVWAALFVGMAILSVKYWQFAAMAIPFTISYWGLSFGRITRNQPTIWAHNAVGAIIIGYLTFQFGQGLWW